MDMIRTGAIYSRHPILLILSSCPHSPPLLSSALCSAPSATSAVKCIRGFVTPARLSRLCFALHQCTHSINIPATAAVQLEANAPPSIARIARRVRSVLRSGANGAIPPS